MTRSQPRVKVAGITCGGGTAVLHCLTRWLVVLAKSVRNLAELGCTYSAVDNTLECKRRTEAGGVHEKNKRPLQGPQPRLPRSS